MLGANDASSKFVKLADMMLTALTVTDFDVASAKMKSFVVEHSEGADWFKWWLNRRTHSVRSRLLKHLLLI